MNDQRARSSVVLTGVPETMLWPLWNRAAEMKRKDRLIDDPMVVELVDRIDYGFAENFGKPSAYHAIRARVGDDLIADYISRHSNDAVVVALGEGLETQLWRVGAGAARWYSVDLPEAIAVRRKLLPTPPDAVSIACSALDPSWMDAVPQGARPFVSAAGLLMYFDETEVRSLLTRVAARFPGGEMFFDTVTPYMSHRTRQGFQVTKRYTAPIMPWGITVDDLPEFLSSIQGLGKPTIQSYFEAFPKRTRLYKLLSQIRPLRVRFAGALVHVPLTSQS